MDDWCLLRILKKYCWFCTLYHIGHILHFTLYHIGHIGAGVFFLACPVYHQGGKSWFLWMIVACYLGRVTNLLALLWLIYGPSLLATYTVLQHQAYIYFN